MDDKDRRFVEHLKTQGNMEAPFVRRLLALLDDETKRADCALQGLTPEMAAISERIGQEIAADKAEVARLTAENERLSPIVKLAAMIQCQWEHPKDRPRSYRAAACNCLGCKARDALKETK